MSDSNIRRATPADADTIIAFNAAMAAETEDRQLDRAVLAGGVRRVLADPSLGMYYLAQRDGNIVGQLLITCESSDWRNALFWWIQSVYVLPAARRRGMYRALHEHVVRAARQAGNVCGVRLYVDKRNTAAQAVYRRLGLRPSEYDLYETDWSLPPVRPP